MPGWQPRPHASEALRGSGSRTPWEDPLGDAQDQLRAGAGQALGREALVATQAAREEAGDVRPGGGGPPAGAPRAPPLPPPPRVCRPPPPTAPPVTPPRAPAP